MSEPNTHYPARLWVPFAEDVAAGYARDPLGRYVLLGLVVYGPDTAKLRALKLREVSRQASPGRPGAMAQDDPPGPERLAEAWAERQKVEQEAGAMVSEALWRQAAGTGPQADLAQAILIREYLTPPPRGEDRDEFYRRVGAVHAQAAETTDKPTAALAELAGVPAGTAASWVSRAKARGLYGQAPEPIKPEKGEQ